MLYWLFVNLHFRNPILIVHKVVGIRFLNEFWKYNLMMAIRMQRTVHATINYKIRLIRKNEVNTWRRVLENMGRIRNKLTQPMRACERFNIIVFPSYAIIFRTRGISPIKITSYTKRNIGFRLIMFERSWSSKNRKS